MPDLCEQLTWRTIAADLRRALAAAGKPAWFIESTVADLSPIFAACERARNRVDDPVVFAALSLAADRARRHARHVRSASYG